MTDAPRDISVLRWSAHPARDHVGRALLGGVAIVALSMAAATLGGGPGWGLGAAAFLVIALNRFYLPSRFVIDEDGITARYPLTRMRFAWRDIRHVTLGPEAGWLSTRAHDRRRRGRGVHVLFGRRRDAVLVALRAHGPERAPAAEAGA